MESLRAGEESESPNDAQQLKLATIVGRFALDNRRRRRSAGSPGFAAGGDFRLLSHFEPRSEILPAAVLFAGSQTVFEQLRCDVETRAEVCDAAAPG